jgi:PPOX class probable F420-dependent enzyme
LKAVAVPDIAEIPESHRDLTDRKVCVLSTLGSGGYPQSTAIWFMLDDDRIIRTSLLNTRQKYKNLLAHPKATIFAIDAANPYHTLEVRCDVVLTDDPDLTMMRRIVEYYGQDFDTFPAPKEGRIKVEFIPRHVVASG